MTQLPARFLSKIQKTPTCWLWTGSQNRNHYGRFGFQSKNQYAHRVMWKLLNGPIPKTICVLHRCDNPPCVNPAHLFLGTPKDNKQDSISKGRKTNGNWHKTICTHGHRFTTDNTYPSPSGKRACRACHRYHSRLRRRTLSRNSSAPCP